MAKLYSLHCDVAGRLGADTMAWQDDWHNPHDLPKVLRDMERQNQVDNGLFGFFFSALVMVCIVCAVCLAISGCAVSLSFQPATWKPAQTEAVTKSKAVE